MNKITKDIILIVEDTQSIIELVSTVLHDNGFQISVAKNGLQALKIAPKLKPNLILLDILMPEMDGYETCRLLKENADTKEIPVIFMSALAKSFDKVKAFSTGGVDYINKPIEIEEMLARIDTHLSISKLKNELQKSNENLERKVKIRTSELANSLEQLEQKTQKLQESEELNTLLLNNVVYPIVMYHFDGKIIYLNQKGIEFLASENNPTNLNINNYLVNTEEFNDILTELKKDGIVQNKEILLTDFSGKIVIARMSSNVIKYHNETVILSVFNDITKLRQLQKELIRKVIAAEENERTRIAQELHDGVGPIISSAKMYSQVLLSPTSKMDKHEVTLNIEELLIEAQATVRQISYSLSPHILQNFGLVEALKSFSQKIEAASKLKINITANTKAQLSNNVETSLYRILCECINNTVKHAKASRIDISLNFSKSDVNIIYKDNGIGFDFEEIRNSKKGIGIFNIINRLQMLDGKIEYKTKPNEGLTIYIEINNS